MRFNFKIKFDHLMSRLNTEEGFLCPMRTIQGLPIKRLVIFFNIWFSGYAILDKCMLLSLHEFGLINNPKPQTIK